jgi:alkylhydroperoxidase family enzyme
MSNAELSGLPAGNWKLMPAPRVRPLERERTPRLARVMLAIIRRAENGREDYNVFATLARLGRIFPAHTIFLSQLLKAGHIPIRDKELVILRVAWRLGAVYEYGHHLHIARHHGVSGSDITAATTEPAGEQNTRLGALLAATDELLTTGTLSDEGWSRLRHHASEDELIELTIIVGHYVTYVMVSMMLNTIGVQLEPQFAATIAAHAPDGAGVLR